MPNVSGYFDKMRLYRHLKTELLRRLYVLSLRQPVDGLVLLARWMWLHSWAEMMSTWSGDDYYYQFARNAFSESIEQVRARS